jgi:hypothetical protein
LADKLRLRASIAGVVPSSSGITTIMPFKPDDLVILDLDVTCKGCEYKLTSAELGPPLVGSKVLTCPKCQKSFSAAALP